MLAEGHMKIELRDSDVYNLLSPYVPRHHTAWGLGVGFNSGGPDGFPAVVEVPEEEGREILRVFAEWQKVQERLRQFPQAEQVFKECQCGNCPR